LDRNLPQIAYFENFINALKDNYNVQVQKTFWITTSFYVKVDYIVSSAAFCFSLPKINILKRRAVKYLGYHCFILDPTQLNQNYIEKIKDLIEHLSPRTVKIKPIKEREFPEKLSLHVENRIIDIASETAKLQIYDINTENLLRIAETWIPGIRGMHSAMDKLVLTDLGYSFKRVNEHLLNYHEASERLSKMMKVMEELFGEYGSTTVSNLFTLSAPNFIKNLLILGGPRVNPGLIEIKSYDEFLENVQVFSEEMQSCKVYLDLDELKNEICSFKNKIILEKKFDWIKDFCVNFTA